MLPLKTEDSSRFQVRALFDTSDSFSLFTPVLSDMDFHVLGGGLPFENQKISVYFLNDPVHQGRLILEYREQIRGKKLSFKEKVYFLKNFSELYPLCPRETIFNWLSFPVVKADTLHWFLNLPAEDFQAFLEAGLSSLREMEALREMQATRIPFLLKHCAFKGQTFRLALNLAFETFRLGYLDQIDTNLTPENFEKALTALRYPEFFKKLSLFESKLKEIRIPGNIRINSPLFFEGRKLLLSMDLKNSQQWMESFGFLQKYQKEIGDLLQILNTSL